MKTVTISILEPGITTKIHKVNNDLSTAAATLGRKGGSARSEAKTAAVRENGRKGGRPMSWKSKNQKRASELASLAHQLDRRGDTVLRDQAVRELRGVLAHYPGTNSTREYRGEWVTVVYRLPSGAKTTNIWTAVEKWRAL